MLDNRKPRNVLQTWASGEALVGAAIKVPSPFVAESVAAAGFDYVYVDQQHGVFDDPHLLSTLQAISAGGAVPLTRVPVNRPDLVHKALDFGAAGVIVPLVESAADAASAAAACRYPPNGNRSYGVLRPKAAGSLGRQRQSRFDRPVCILLIETEKGMTNLDAIAQTAGVDAIMVGPQDLALSLGLELRGDWIRAPKLLEAIEQIRSTCGQRGIAAGIGTSSGGEASGWLARGFQFVNVGNDLAYIRDSLARELATAREALLPSRNQ